MRKYKRALYLRISALVNKGAIITPITKIVTIEIIVVTFVDTIFYSAWYSDSLAYNDAKVTAAHLKPLLPFSIVKYNYYSYMLGL